MLSIMIVIILAVTLALMTSDPRTTVAQTKSAWQTQKIETSNSFLSTQTKHDSEQR